MQLAAYPSSLSQPLTEALLLAGVTVKLLDEAATTGADTSDWSVILVELGDEPMRHLREAGRLLADTGVPVFVVAQREHLPLLDSEREISDFIIGPPDAVELRVRLGRLVADKTETEIREYRDLSLNTATYQATVGSKPVDLTYMEYELLRYFVENQGRVWSREQLLSKVWGYDYYGGARTVDVHVRRLRSKLGEERSSWITTVRSVGYRFG
jgi:DNA-binding response OmpR family regulator